MYGIKYSPRMNRIVLPIYKDGALVAYLLRAVGKDSPKYIAKYKGDKNVCFHAECTKRGQSYDLVVVEDMLSAMRVAYCNTARSILGTASSIEVVMPLLEGLPKLPKIAVWLDPDNAGKKGRFDLARQLRLLGAEVTVIVTDKDPKYYANDEIKEILGYVGPSPTEVDAKQKDVLAAILSDTG